MPHLHPRQLHTNTPPSQNTSQDVSQIAIHDLNTTHIGETMAAQPSPLASLPSIHPNANLHLLLPLNVVISLVLAATLFIALLIALVMHQRRMKSQSSQIKHEWSKSSHPTHPNTAYHPRRSSLSSSCSTCTMIPTDIAPPPSNNNNNTEKDRVDTFRDSWCVGSAPEHHPSLRADVKATTESSDEEEDHVAALPSPAALARFKTRRTYAR